MAGAWHKWRNALRHRMASLRARLGAESVSAAELDIEGHHYVFGLDWRMMPQARRMGRALALARQEGMRWYARSEVGDIVGVINARFSSRGPRFSAPLHLASGFSQGGLELFVFAFSQRYAVIALQDSRPLPGYDVLADLATAQSMAEEFLAIQRGQPIRMVGNVSWLEGYEPVEPEDLFSHPIKSARLFSMRSSRALVQGLMLMALAGVIVTAGAMGLERWRNEARLELQRSPAYQQKVYAEGLAQAWSRLPAMPNDALRRWYESVRQLPTVHRGWALVRAECDLARCKAEWTSLYGSRADFLQNLPSQARLLDDDSLEQDPLVLKLLTSHDLSSSADSAKAKRESLPSTSQARRELGDLLHDLKMLGASTARIEPLRLLGGEGDPAVLVDPVFVGNWVLRHGLWLLPSLRLPEFVRVETLAIELTPSKRAGSEMAPEGGADSSALKSGEPYFALTGTYYARQ